MALSLKSTRRADFNTRAGTRDLNISLANVDGQTQRFVIPYELIRRRVVLDLIESLSSFGNVTLTILLVVQRSAPNPYRLPCPTQVHFQ